LDLYPNGCDRSKDSSDSVISLHLRLASTHQHKEEHVRAQYRFSLLDVAGNPAYELPGDTGVFVCPRLKQMPYGYGVDVEDPFFGYAEFIRREELERRRDSLLVDDRLAVRCDVAVVQLEPAYLGPKDYNTSRQRHEDYSDWEEDGSPRETRRRHWQASMDVRWGLANNKGTHGRRRVRSPVPRQ
jgi:speckle-type POZ protein